MNNSLIIIALQIVVVLSSGFLIAYVKRKASNYADKDDLKTLTAIVEKEKSKYATDLSVIKAQLDVATGNRRSYREKEVEAIVEFYSVCNWLVYDFLNLDFTWFNSAHLSEIERLNNSAFENIKKMTVAKGKFDLFVSDLDLRSAGFALHSGCIDYTAKVQSFLLGLSFSLKKQIDSRDEFLKYFKSGTKDINNENRIIREEQLLNKEIADYPEAYKKIRNEEHDAKVIKSIAQFESCARVYLSKI